MTSASPVGRPRHFTNAEERQLIMDAAMAVMARSGYADAPLGDILSEGGVSTRAFYRHFATKDALLLALYRRDAEAVGTRLQRIVDAVEDPVDALGAWVDGFLYLFYEPRRARRVALFMSPAVQRAEGYDAEFDHTRSLLAASVAHAVRRGVEAGSFHSDDPHTDAAMIVAGAFEATRVRQRGRNATRTLILRFAQGALVTAGGPARRRR